MTSCFLGAPLQYSFRSLSPHKSLKPTAQVGVRFVTATATCTQSAVAATATAGPASGISVLHSQDPALDNLIDRWLSNACASSSAPGSNGSSSSSAASQQQQQPVPVQDVQLQWAALFSPMVASLSTLEEGDELFALDDSLSHLGSSLQELQQLALQLLTPQQQQQQQEEEEQAESSAAQRQQYTEELVQLLSTAAQSASDLDDGGLVNLLAIATVLLTSNERQAESETSTSSLHSSQVRAAASQALRAAEEEMWQRPGVATGLDVAQLTSLSVVLRRLTQQSGVLEASSASVLSLSAYRRLQQLAETNQLSLPQLGVCCWCLSSVQVPPPAATIAACLHAAAASLQGAGSADSFDGLALRRLAAACVNWQPYIDGILFSSAGSESQSSSDAAQVRAPQRGRTAANSLSAAADNFISSATASVGQCVTSRHSSTAGDAASSSHSVWRVAASLAQAAAVLGVHPGQGFVAIITQQLLQGFPLSSLPAAAEAGDAAVEAKELQDIAAAAGYLLPWWELPDAPQQQQVIQAINSAGLRQQQQQQQQRELRAGAQGSNLTSNPVWLAFLAALQQSSSTAARRLSSAQALQLRACLDLIAEHLVRSSSSSSGNSNTSIVCDSHCIDLLLRCMSAANCRSEQLLLLAELQLSATSGNATSCAAATAVAVLCRQQPAGWQQVVSMLAPHLLSADGSAPLQQVPLQEVLALHSSLAAGIAATSDEALVDLAAAVLQHLLHPHTVLGASSLQAADLLVHLTVRQQPWGLSSGQRFNLPPPVGLAQAGGKVDTMTLLQQQWLRCMNLIVRDSARSLLPHQLVPLLASLTFIRQSQAQQQQRQPWPGQLTGRLLHTYKYLSNEVVAAVSLQLQDSTGLLTPPDIAWASRLLALLQVRPVLALNALVQAAAGRAVQFGQQDLTWMLWGLTKLKFTGKLRLQRQLLTAALVGAAGRDRDRHRQQPEVDQEQPQQPGEVQRTTGGSSGSESGFDSNVTLLWVAAQRSYSLPQVAQLLQAIVEHPAPARPAQAASVLWSYCRLLQSSVAQQQRQHLEQQRGDVLRLVQGSLSCTTHTRELLPRHVAVLMWGWHKLGHQPPDAVTAAVVASASHHMQAQDQAGRVQDTVPFLPGELSCLLYCLASWDFNLDPDQLLLFQEYLHTCLIQQVSCTAPTETETETGNGATEVFRAGGGSKSSSRGAAAAWDGPAICHSVWALAQLGAQLPHDMLEAAEAGVVALLSGVTSAAGSGEHHSDTSSSGSLANQHLQHLTQQPQQRQQQQQVSPPPPSASDLALLGTACRGAAYQPAQLLQHFRSFVLLQIARKGAAGLLVLQRTRPAAGRFLPTTQAKAHAHHAHVVVSVLLFLRQTQYSEPALLQQLEHLLLHPPVAAQLNPRQVVILLSCFCRLGYVPRQWFGTGGLLRALTQFLLGARSPLKSGPSSRNNSGSMTPPAASLSRSSFSSTGEGLLSVKDCVIVLECLAAWSSERTLTSNCLLQQYVLPGLLQRLLGVEHTGDPSGPGGPHVTNSPARSGSNGSSSDGSSSSSSSNTPASEAAAAADNSITQVDPADAPTHMSSSRNSDRSTGISVLPVSSMPGWQVLSLLRSLPKVDFPRSARQLQQQLTQQLMQRAGMVWPELHLQNQVAGALAASKLGYDLSGNLNMQELLSACAGDVNQQKQQQQQSTASSGGMFSTPSAASRLLWVFGNAGRHPGYDLLTAALSSVAAAGVAAATAGEALPLREVSTALYASAVLQELQHPVAVQLAQLCHDAAASGRLLNHPQFNQQSEQLAVCLLTAQDIDRAAAKNTTRPAAASTHITSQQTAAAATSRAAPGPADGGPGGLTPWLTLPGEVQQRLVEAWRRKVLRKAGGKSGNRKGMSDHMQLLLTLRQLGVRGRANLVTEDGLVCADVAIITNRGDRIAVELLGPHNAASNTQRPWGPARLKWRLLIDRGYKVLVVNAWQWRMLDSGFARGRFGYSSSSNSNSNNPESSLEEYDGDIVSEKLMYLQARLQAVLGPAAAAALSSRRLPPAPPQVTLGPAGSGIVRQQQEQQQQQD